VAVYDFDVCEEHSIPFFTMEHINGEGLDRVLAGRRGKLPTEKAMDIACQMCDALAYAHQSSVHRDLKPQNIMLRPDGSVKILDFGIAQIVDSEGQTRTKKRLGTPYYQAPEQLKGGVVDERADLYSLGVVLYQLLTGEIPQGAFRPPSQLVEGVPAALDAVVMQCLEPKPKDRYRSAKELRTALEAVSTARAGPKAAKWALVAAATAVAIFVTTLLYQGLQSPPDTSEVVVGAGSNTGIPQSPREAVFPPQRNDAGKKGVPDEQTTVLEVDFGLYRRGGHLITDGNVLGSREHFWIEFRANRDCYIYVLNEGTSGKTVPLYPRRDVDGGSFVLANHKVRLPSDEQDYSTDDTTGTEKVMLVASLKPLHDIEHLTRKNESGLISVADRSVLEQAIQTRDIGVVKRVETNTKGLNIEVLRGTSSVVETVSFFHRP